MSEKAAVVAPPVRGKNQELWVGLFVIIGTLTTVYLLLTLTDAAMFRGRYIVSSTVKDASGVRKGDPVQMRGVGIGRVQKFVIFSGGVSPMIGAPPAGPDATRNRTLTPLLASTTPTRMRDSDRSVIR